MSVKNRVMPGILVTAVVAVVAPATVLAAPRPDFDAVVSAVEQRYNAHVERVPMMGFVSFCAWVATGGGVKGMKVAEFDHLAKITDPAELEGLMDDSLGGGWQRFVTERNRRGEVSVIYVQPSGAAMRMLIADYEHGELDLVRMEVNANRLRHWMRDPKGSVNRHDYGAEKGTPD